MAENKAYLQFVKEVKQQILQSRYQVAKLVNKEVLSLYYSISRMLDEKITQAKWGEKVLQTISADLQNELAGLRGFSAQNLKKMRIFYGAYPTLLKNKISSSLTNQLSDKENAQAKEIGSSATNQLGETQENIFFLLSFTHHFLLISKIKDASERFFYMQQAASNHWTVSLELKQTHCISL